MIFEYAVQKTFNQNIDIVDFGNTALKCSCADLVDYYLLTKTFLGKTHIFTFGPVCTDFSDLLDDFTVNYKKIDYKESQICKEINKFINDFRKGIDKIEEVTAFEALADFPNIQQFFNNIEDYNGNK